MRRSGSADVERGEEATPRRTRTASARSRRRSRPSASSSYATRWCSISTTRCATHVPEVPPGPTVGDALSHLSGLQREPPGDIWETLEPPTREEPARRARGRRARPAPGRGVALLEPRVRAPRRDRGPAERRPLRGGAPRARARAARALARPGSTRQGHARPGYYVDPYSDRVTVEADPAVEGPIAAMGWLWSTVGDLARWGDFLATGRDGVLSVETLDEMARVRTMADQATWSLGWGLGLELYRRGDRVFVGHGGAMPGFLAAVCVHRPERTGAVVLCNTAPGRGPRASRSTSPRRRSTSFRAHPRRGAPTAARRAMSRRCSVAGGRRARSSCSRGAAGGFGWSSWRDRPGAASRGSAARRDDRWRIVEGRELGELLRVSRDDAGAPVEALRGDVPAHEGARGLRGRRLRVIRSGRRRRRTRPRPPRTRRGAPRRAPSTRAPPQSTAWSRREADRRARRSRPRGSRARAGR